LQKRRLEKSIRLQERKNAVEEGRKEEEEPGITAVVVDMGSMRREAMEKTRLRTILSLFVFWLPQ
jgi:hypothetical protein